MIDRIIIVVYFLAELLVSESVFLVHCRRRSWFWVRLPLSVAAYIAVAMLLDAVFNLLPQTVPFRIAFFLLFSAFSVPAILFDFQLTFLQAVFVAIAGYSVEHIAEML